MNTEQLPLADRDRSPYAGQNPQSPQAPSRASRRRSSSSAVALTVHADEGSPYGETLRRLHMQRAVLETELQKVMTAIEGLEALDRTTRRRFALGGASVMFQGLELQGRTSRAAAETVLLRVGTPLAGGELRKLIEQGGRTITYRALYNMLKKRTSTFRQLPDKRWTLTMPPELRPE